MGSFGASRNGAEAILDAPPDWNNILTMTNETTQVLNAALHLPHKARAFLAERLLESLDTEPEFPISSQWLTEIRRRCQEIDRDEVDLIPEEQVFKQAFEALK
jgi:putative addiction module component (TIGR02574 family)